PIDRPIELRREIISPAVQHPLSGIAIELGVGIKMVATRFRRISGTPDAKWTDSEFHPRLCCLDVDVDFVNQTVDVGATPIIAGEISAGSQVLSPAGCIRKIHHSSAPILLLVRIEVIIDVHSIDVIAMYD